MPLPPAIMNNLLHLYSCSSLWIYGYLWRQFLLVCNRTARKALPLSILHLFIGFTGRGWTFHHLEIEGDCWLCIFWTDRQFYSMWYWWYFLGARIDGSIFSHKFLSFLVIICRYVHIKFEELTDSKVDFIWDKFKRVDVAIVVYFFLFSYHNFHLLWVLIHFISGNIICWKVKDSIKVTFSLNIT